MKFQTDEYGILVSVFRYGEETIIGRICKMGDGEKHFIPEEDCPPISATELQELAERAAEKQEAIIEKAAARVRQAGVQAPESVIREFVTNVGPNLICASSLSEIWKVASAF